MGQTYFSRLINCLKIEQWNISQHLGDIGNEKISLTGLDDFAPESKIGLVGVGFTKPPLEKTYISKGRSLLFLLEGHLKIQFQKASFNSPYQRSSLKLKEGPNVL